MSPTVKLLVLLAVVAGVLLLVTSKAHAGDAAPPPVVVDAPTNAAGQEVGSPEAIAAAGAAWEAGNTARAAAASETIMGGLGTGLSTGFAIGGPIGAIVGAIVGIVAGIVSLFAGGDYASSPPPPPFPWAEVGLPFRPDHARPQEDGGIAVGVPDQKNIAQTSWVVMTAARLAEFFPGAGAVQACRASGMFAWRPGDFETPFSIDLNKAAPWLAEYEARFIRSDFGPDFDELGTTFGWDHINPNTATDADAVMWTIMGRKAAAFRERRSLVFEPFRQDEIGGGGSKYARDAILFATANPFEVFWLRHYIRAYLDQGPDFVAQMAHSRMFRVFCNTLDASMEFPDPHHHPEPPAGVRLVQMGGNPKLHVSPSRAGFPGAWRLRPDVLPGGVSPRTAVTRNLVAGFSVLARGRTPVIAATPAPVAPAAPAPTDTQNAFAFEVWGPWGSQVVQSSRFAQLLGSYAAVRSELEAGRLAWHPKANSSDIAAVWRQVFAVGNPGDERDGVYRGALGALENWSAFA